MYIAEPENKAILGHPVLTQTIVKEEENHVKLCPQKEDKDQVLSLLSLHQMFEVTPTRYRA